MYVTFLSKGLLVVISESDRIPRYELRNYVHVCLYFEVIPSERHWINTDSQRFVY